MKWLFIFYSLSSSIFDGVLVSTDKTKSLENHCSEYWYMGSILAKSKMQKNSKDALNATGLYPYLVSSICCSVILDYSTLLLISWLVFLEFESSLINDSSFKNSSILPSVLERAFRIESSICISVFLSSAFFITISNFFCYSWGFSNATIWANICSSNPEGVIAKLITETLTNISGG